MMSGAAIDTSTFINFKNIDRFDIFSRLNYHLYTTIYVIMELRNGSESTVDKFNKLFDNGKIKHVSLSISDLIEMANVPESNRISNAELSCFIKAREFNNLAFCDDSTAKKYIRNYIDTSHIKGTKDLLIESYCNDIIDDYEIVKIIKTLKDNKFAFRDDIHKFAAERKHFQNIKYI